MQLNGSVVKCECNGELFRVTRELDKTYAIPYTIERIVCIQCDSVVIESEMEGEFV